MLMSPFYSCAQSGMIVLECVGMHSTRSLKLNQLNKMMLSFSLCIKMSAVKDACRVDLIHSR